MKRKIEFENKSYKLNKDPNFNFQLNRLILWDYGRVEDISLIAEKIVDSASWKREIVALGDKALEDNRVESAIGYYRMAEFFMYDGDPDKLKYYKLSTELFYDYYAEIFHDGTIEKIEIPYEGKTIPVMFAKAQGKKKDTILLHGGNDSYYEEFLKIILHLSQEGYDVYMLEGPGQGVVLRERGIKFTPRWEKPVKAALDQLGLEDVTIIGCSLGGMLAPRAAAFDKRIKRVIGWSVFTNFLDVALYELPKRSWGVVKFMIKHNIKGPINKIMYKKMKNNNKIDWGIRHGMFAYDAKTPFDYLKKLDEFQMLDIGHKITQDMLVLGSENDHFIPLELYKKELDALVNVRSLTYRLVTSREGGDNHCNVGNTALALDIMTNWIDEIKRTY